MKSNVLFSFKLLLVLLLAGLFSCKLENDPAGQKAGAKLNIVTTTGILKDAVVNITGNKAEVTSIMGPGVDPHLYKATQGDLKKLQEADIIIYNGLHLEGKMGEVLEKLAKRKTVVAASDGIPENELRRSAEFATSFDPHIWFDVALWQKSTRFLSSQIQKKDTVNAAFYKGRTEAYTKSLDSLHHWVGTQIATIPEQQRTLITAHDAFGYFGRAYNIQVRGLQGISTVSEFGLRDVADLVNYIVSNKIKAVFVETSVSPKAIEAVVEGCRGKGHPIRIGGSLYSDALGEENTGAGTYSGMVKENVNTIVKALK